MTLIDELTALLPARGVVTDPDVMASYRHDRAQPVTAGTPSAVAFPTTTEQVAGVMRIATVRRTPVVVRGAGSGLAGAANAVDGGIILCTERMDRRLDLDPDDQTATVDPGVINAEVSRAAAGFGLFYPPDPASHTFSTIGGNVATNAGGLCCVRHGVTRDHVLGLEVVLADGTTIETGRTTIKGVAGLDLTGLIVGSEGTLGIVTRATLRLRPAPDGAATAVASFPTLGAAGDAVTRIVASGAILSLVEIMDRASVVVVDDWGHFGLDREAAALLLLQSDEPAPLRGSIVERAAGLCDAAGATSTFFTDDPLEADALLQARRSVASAIEALPSAGVLHEDVAVPRSRICDMIAAVEEIGIRHDVRTLTFGHAGDGNLHPLLVGEDPESFERAIRAFDDVLSAALELGGTITGEHGVGRVKRHFLEREVGVANLALQRRLKETFDPHRLLRPDGWI
ncbi:MAG: FAD-linked oxidase C-terminal domain-containing protein [Nitriliruptoraceae bacterium]